MYAFNGTLSTSPGAILRHTQISICKYTSNDVFFYNVTIQHKDIMALIQIKNFMIDYVNQLINGKKLKKIIK